MLSCDDPPPNRVAVGLQFSEKGFGFGELLFVQTPEGLCLDAETMRPEHVKRYLGALVDSAILDSDLDPERHAKYNEIRGRGCGPRCPVCGDTPETRAVAEGAAQRLAEFQKTLRDE